jgi:hypothetical protein
LRQKAAVSVLAEPLFAEEAKKRQQIRKGNQPGAKVEKLPQLEKGKARDEAAKVFGVSGRYVSQAKKLKAELPEREIKRILAFVNSVKSNKEAKKRLKTSTGGLKPRPVEILPHPENKGMEKLPYLKHKGESLSPKLGHLKSTKQAAKAFGVSGSYVTQAKIAAMLGVGLETVSRWLRKGTNSHMGNASIPDARVKVSVWFGSNRSAADISVPDARLKLSVWFGTNRKFPNTSAPDARVKVPPKQRK